MNKVWKNLRWKITRKGESTINRVRYISNLSLSSSATSLIKSKVSIEAHHLGKKWKEEEEEDEEQEKQR